MRLYGIAEIAAEIGERRQTVAQWHKRGKLPAPTAELAMGPVWTHEDLAEWLTNVQEGTTMTRWTTLELVDGDGCSVTGERRLAALQEFRVTGAINGVFFARIGLPHEDPEDASTWGPQSPAHVDWTGFEPDLATVARTLAEALNTYAETAEPGEANPWEDVIRPKFGNYLDEIATQDADPSNSSDVVILLDGGRVYYDHSEKTWRIG